MPNDLPDWQRQAYTRLLLGQITVAPNTTSPVTNFVLPVGCLAVAFQANTQPSPPNNVTITGHVTGNVYFNGSPGSLFTSRFIDPQIDTSIDVTITSPLTLGSSVTFLAVEVPENVFVRNSTGEPIPVQTGTGGTTSFVDVTDRAPRLVGIVQEGNSPPPWQAPNQKPVTIDATIGAGATITILPSATGQRIRLFGLAITATAVVQIGSNGEIGSIAAGGTWAVNLGGALNDPGTFVPLSLTAPAGASSVNGIVSYSQGATV